MLTITDVRIVKNTRILLGEDCNIHYAPQSPYQVIVGQNGVGKTTFLTALLAYPTPGGKSFHKQGFSTVTFEKDGKTITATVSHDGKYRFTVDGEEHNTGGTQSVQRDLFATWLGITPILETVLSPKFDFLAMLPQKRQEFLAKLTTGDLSFALDLYKKLEQRVRQGDNVIKRLESNRTDLQSKVISQDEFEAAKSKLEELNLEIRALLIETDKRSPESTEHVTRGFITRIEKFKTMLSKEWVKHYCFGGCYAKDEEDALDIEKQIEGELVKARVTVDALVSQYQSMDELVHCVSEGNLESIDHALMTLEEEYATLPEQDPLFVLTLPNEEDYRTAHRKLTETLAQMEEGIGAIEVSDATTLMRVDLPNFRLSCQQHKEKLRHYETTVNSLDASINHVHEGNIRCNHCGKQVSVGLDRRRRETQIQQKEEITKKIAHVRSELEDTLLLGKRAKLFQENYRALLQLTRTAALAPIFDKIQHHVSLLENPRAYLQWGYRALASLDTQQRAAAIRNDQAVLEKQKKMMQARDLTSLKSIRDKMDTLDTSIWEAQQQVDHLTTLLDDHRKRLKKTKQYDRWLDTVNQEYVKMGEDLDRNVAWQLNQVRKHLLDSLQAAAGELSAKVNRYERDRYELAHLESLLTQEHQSRSAAREAADELSPKTGLIAEQLFGFIESFFDDVMAVCNRIWTYEVSIFSGKDTTSSLTYLFPVEFNQSGTRSDDIAKTSAGQYSLLNFAVRITALRYLGYQEGVLLLDEPEAEFTPVHKVKMMRFLREAVEAGLFSQVFIISHHESGWGALPYPDIVDFSDGEGLPGTNNVITFK